MCKAPGQAVPEWIGQWSRLVYCNRPWHRDPVGGPADVCRRGMCGGGCV